MADFQSLRRNEIRVAISNPRLMEGHLLVMPRRHVTEFDQLGYEEGVLMFRVCDKLRHLIKASGFAPGCDIRLNDRPYKQREGQVEHVKMHVMPRWPGDPFNVESEKQLWKLFTELTSEEIQATSSKLFPWKASPTVTKVGA